MDRRRNKTNNRRELYAKKFKELVGNSFALKMIKAFWGQLKSKEEVAKIVEMSIKYKKLPKLDDTLDSIAIALCYGRSNLISGAR